MKLSDPSAERAILSGIFRYGKDAYLDVSDIVTTDSFTIDTNQIVYSCLNHLFQKNIDSQVDLPLILSVAHELGLQTYLDNDLAYVQKVLSLSVEQTNLREYAKKIKRLQIARQLTEECKEAINDLGEITGAEPISQIFAKAENRILDFSNKISSEQNESIEKIGEGLDDYFDMILNEPCEQVGLSTGFPIFDKAIGGGLRRKSLTVVGARPGRGKTIIADSISIHNARLNRPVLMLDSEMDITGHWNRILANLSGVEINKIETGKFGLKQSTRNAVIKAKNLLKSLPYYYVSIAGMAFDEVISYMRRWLVKEVGKENGQIRDCLITYDYLKIMNEEGLKNSNMREDQILGFQVTNLTNFAIKYDVPILAAIQLNRDGITKDTSDVIAQSDRVLWFASALAILKDKSPEEIAEYGPESGNKKLIPIKSRYGGGLQDGDYVNLQMNGAIARIEEVGTKNALIKKAQTNGGFEMEQSEA